MDATFPAYAALAVSLFAAAVALNRAEEAPAQAPPLVTRLADTIFIETDADGDHKVCRVVPRKLLAPLEPFKPKPDVPLAEQQWEADYYYSHASELIVNCSN